LRFRHGQAKRRGKFKAKVLVLNAVRQVNSVRQPPDLRLEDMRGRGRAVRHLPFAVPIEQGGLFLRSGKRDPEVLIVANAERVSRKVADDLCHLFIAQRAGVDGSGLAGGHALGKELQRADAIPAHG
jgi:hypothetical protein